MKKFLLLLVAMLLAQGLTFAQVTPVSGKFYKVKHSSGLYLTLDGGSFKIKSEKSDLSTSNQVFLFTAVNGSNKTFTIKVDDNRYLASDTKWNASVLHRTGSPYTQFDVTISGGYTLFKNLGQAAKKGSSSCYLGTDANSAGSSVYSDKAGNDGKHYWTLVEVTDDFEFPVEIAGEDVYPDEDLPEDDPRKNAYPGYKLVFAEEFSKRDGSRPEMGVWTYESGYKRNNERQYYRANEKNIWQENGVCVINGRKETDLVINGEKVDYTAASIRTNFTNDKYNWLFGIFEIRAKIPAYEGMWPAIWSTGRGTWPYYGEIDLLEWYGGVIHGNVCFGNTQWISNTVSYAELNKTDPNTEWGDEYHVWRMYWYYERIEMWCDDVLVNSVDLEDTYNPVSQGAAWSGLNPFRDARHQIWLNLAMGSSGGSLAKIPENNYYLLDYARVYQKIGTDGKCLYHVDPYEPDATIIIPEKDAELSIGSVLNDIDQNAPVEYYNLQGQRLENPRSGQMVIRRQGSKADKIIVGQE